MDGPGVPAGEERLCAIVEAGVPQQQPVAGGRERIVECLQYGIVPQRAQRGLDPGDQEIPDLREGLHDLAGLAALLGQGGRPAWPVLETVLAMEQPELPDRPVVDDAAVGEDVVAVPVQPAEHVLALERRGDPPERCLLYTSDAADDLA